MFARLKLKALQVELCYLIVVVIDYAQALLTFIAVSLVRAQAV